MEMQQDTASKGAFRARSGRTVRVEGNGTVVFDHANGYLSPASAMDAEEFFQAKRDEELGRWRCPTDPDWVAVEGRRDVKGRTVVVVNERTLDRFWFNERVRDAAADVDVAHRVGRAYFEAHPERKPWEGAEPGEVWALRVKHVPGDDAYEIYDDPSQGIQRTCFRSLTDGSIYWVRSESIEDGRRVWPEDAS